MLYSFILSGGGKPMTKEDTPMVILFGLLFFMVGFIPIIYFLNIYLNKIQTNAEITNYEGDNYMFLKFLNSNNNWVESRINISSDKRINFLFPIGSKIEIFYHSALNQNVVLKDKLWGHIISFGFFVLLGLTLITFAVLKMNE